MGVHHPFGNFPFTVPHGFYSGPFGISFEEAMSRRWRVLRYRCTLSVSGSVVRNRRAAGHPGVYVDDPSGGYTLTATSCTGISAPTDSAWRYRQSNPIANGAVIEGEEELSGDVFSSTQTATDLGGDLSISPSSDTEGHPFSTHKHGGMLFQVFWLTGDNDSPGEATAEMYYDPDLNLYYPSTFIGLTLDLYATSSGGTTVGIGLISESLYGGTIGPRATRVSVPAVINGVSYDLPCVWGPAELDSFVSDYSFNLTPQLTVEIIQYWSHPGPDGYARWNDDGSPAINPVTGVPFTTAEIITSPGP